MGLFNQEEAAAPPSPPKVLVAGQNIHKNMGVLSSQVRVRDAYPHEIEDLRNNPDKYMPPLVQAAHLMIAARPIMADTPLLKEHFLPLSIPGNVSDRLGESPYYRAVNVAVPKERCAGGLLQQDEYVDVYLTSSICDGKHCDQAITQTACIARGCKVIVKRNNLWTVMAANPEGQDVHFTLQTNPYRAAIIEYAKWKGLLTLMPAPPGPNKPGSQMRAPGVPTFAEPTSEEYRDEDERVDRMMRNELVVGAPDLERIFKLKPPKVPPPGKEPVMVERFEGLQQVHTIVWDPDGVMTKTKNPPPPDRRPVTDTPGYGYVFHIPGQTGVGSPGAALASNAGG
jgi:hypothetical protein